MSFPADLTTRDMALNLLLYLGAPFFAYPHKPLLHAQKGAEFGRAYFHFRRDHRDPFNLWMHVLCLFYQLAGNFGLLTELDRGLGVKADTFGVGMSLLTAVGWSYPLLVNEAELEVKLAAVLLVWLFYLGRQHLVKVWRPMVVLQAVGDAAIVQCLMLKTPLTDLRLFVGLLALRLVLTVLAFRLRGVLEPYRQPLNAALLAYMIFGTAQNPYHGTPWAFMLGLVGWIPAVLSNQPGIYFYSTGFAATAVQGVAHFLSGEQGTMPTLHNYADETAHVTYFPVLLLKSCYESLRGVPFVGDA